MKGAAQCAGNIEETFCSADCKAEAISCLGVLNSNSDGRPRGMIPLFSCPNYAPHLCNKKAVLDQRDFLVHNKDSCTGLNGGSADYV